LLLHTLNYHSVSLDQIVIPLILFAQLSYRVLKIHTKAATYHTNKNIAAKRGPFWMW
jgi:hypothetical protein